MSKRIGIYLNQTSGFVRDMAARISKGVLAIGGTPIFQHPGYFRPTETPENLDAVLVLNGANAIIEHFRARSVPVIVLDGGYFPGTWSWGLGSHYWVPDVVPPGDRAAAMGLFDYAVTPGTGPEAPLVFLGQGPAFLPWFETIARRIRAEENAPVLVYRPHPRKNEVPALGVFDGIDQGGTLEDALDGAGGVVAHTSAAALVALMSGIPAWCHPSAFYARLAGDAENPGAGLPESTPEQVQSLLESVAWTQWRPNEIARGLPLHFLLGEWPLDMGVDPIPARPFAVLIPTGDRPLGLDMALDFVAAQTLQPDQVVVVDDGKKPYPKAKRVGFDYVRRTPRKADPPHTLALNLAEGLKHVREGLDVVIVEDDDFYRPDYLETVADLLADADLVGQDRIHYYNLQARTWKSIRCNRASPMCSMGFSPSVFPLIQSLAEELPDRVANRGSVDLAVWERFDGPRAQYGGDLVVGIKGIAGRPGMGRDSAGNYTPDPDGEKLRELVGRKQAEIYTQMGE